MIQEALEEKLDCRTMNKYIDCIMTYSEKRMNESYSTLLNLEDMKDAILKNIREGKSYV